VEERKTFDFNYEEEIRRLIRKFGLTKEEAEGLMSQSYRLIRVEQLFKNKNFKIIAILIITIFFFVGIIWICYKYLRNA